MNTMEELRELLAYVKPELVLMPMNRQMCLMDGIKSAAENTDSHAFLAFTGSILRLSFLC